MEMPVGNLMNLLQLYSYTVCVRNVATLAARPKFGHKTSAEYFNFRARNLLFPLLCYFQLCRWLADCLTSSKAIRLPACIAAPIGLGLSRKVNLLRFNLLINYETKNKVVKP